MLHFLPSDNLPWALYGWQDMSRRVYRVRCFSPNNSDGWVDPWYHLQNECYVETVLLIYIRSDCRLLSDFPIGVSCETWHVGLIVWEVIYSIPLLTIYIYIYNFDFFYEYYILSSYYLRVCTYHMQGMTESMSLSLQHWRGVGVAWTVSSALASIFLRGTHIALLPSATSLWTLSHLWAVGEGMVVRWLHKTYIVWFWLFEYNLQSPCPVVLHCQITWGRGCWEGLEIITMSFFLWNEQHVMAMIFLTLICSLCPFQTYIPSTISFPHV